MLDKKADLEKVARQVFAEKGYKKTNISDITKRAGMAVGSFYKYYSSKEELFLAVYVQENERIREEVMQRVDWQASPEEIIENLFAITFSLISPNKIMAEWGKPDVSNLLYAHYAKDDVKKENHFHQFLVETFSQRLQSEHLPPDLIAQIMKVYDFIYYLDMKISDQDFEGYSEVMETFIKYFIKGIFSQSPKK